MEYEDMISAIHILAIITAILPAPISIRWFRKRKGTTTEHVALSLITLFIVNSVVALSLGLTGWLTIEGILITTSLVDGAMFLYGESKNL
ncbi:MAG: hypothetical protein ACLFTH_00630 [Candidatus Woesearchaeota archaeon]